MGNNRIGILAACQHEDLPTGRGLDELTNWALRALSAYPALMEILEGES